MQTQCCIAGCGPAGAMLGLLLARQGLQVTVLEKHADFLRDFRGDDLTPTTLEILDELGLAEAFLELGPRRLSLVQAHMPEGTLTLADLTRLPTRFPYVAVIPQWDFLDFLTRQAACQPGFRLLMSAEVIDLVEEGGAVRGVRYREGGVTRELRALLTVAADGRGSIVRERAGLELIETAPPIDVLWFRLPRPPDGPEERALSVHLRAGRAMARINRGSYWQIACLIPKGEADRVRAEGLAAFQASVQRLMPDLADQVGSLQSWDQVSLLSVHTNRLRRWYRTGLLCIGDAAHAMSPIGGTGINVAIQDAVSAANHLADPIRRGSVSTRELARVQRQRGWQIRLLQVMQSRLTKSYLLAIESRPGPIALTTRRLARRLLDLPGFGALRSRIVGLGFRRVHVKVRAASPEP